MFCQNNNCNKYIKIYGERKYHNGKVLEDGGEVNWSNSSDATLVAISLCLSLSGCHLPTLQPSARSLFFSLSGHRGRCSGVRGRSRSSTLAPLSLSNMRVSFLFLFLFLYFFFPQSFFFYFFHQPFFSFPPIKQFQSLKKITYLKPMNRLLYSKKRLYLITYFMR